MLLMNITWLRWYGGMLIKERRGGYHQEDDNYACAVKEKKGEAQEKDG